MNTHLSEDEQVEALKKWWKENGVAVIVGVVIGIGAIIGFWKWREYTETRAYLASDVYVEFTEALAENKDEIVAQRYDTLIKDYASTSYAVFAAMYMAKQAVEKEDLVKAANQLKWALDHAGADALAHLARVRLANVLVAQNKYDEALTLVQAIPASAFDAEYAEIKGDVYRYKGNAAEARESYQAALNSNLLNGKRREFVQMKLSDLSAQATAANSVSSDTVTNTEQTEAK